MNISNKLNSLMKEYDIKNPKELSKELEKQKLKIPYTTLMTILNNDVQDIKLGNAKKLCKFFNITMDELLGEDFRINESFKVTLNLEGLSDNDINEVKQIIEIKKQNKRNNK